MSADPSALCVTALGIDDSIWCRSGVGDGAPLVFKRLQAKVKAVLPPPSTPPPPSGLSSPGKLPLLASPLKDLDPSNCLSFVFPSGINLHSTWRQRSLGNAPSATSPAASQGSSALPFLPSSTLRVSMTPPTSYSGCEPEAVSFSFAARVLSGRGESPRGGGAGVVDSLHQGGSPSALHTFMLPNNDNGFFYGTALVRWHPIDDVEKVGLMKMQLAAALLLRNEPGDAKLKASVVGGGKGRERASRSTSSGDQSWTPEELQAWFSACAVADEQAHGGGGKGGGPHSKGILTMAGECWEPSALVVFIAQPYFETLRAVLNSLDRALHPGQRLDASVAALVYASLHSPSGGSVSSQPSLSKSLQWTFTVHEEREGVEARNSSSSSSSSSVGIPKPCGIRALPPPPEALPTSASLTTLFCTLLPWVPEGTQPFVFPPSHELSWELPPRKWLCGDCMRVIPGVTRARLREMRLSGGGGGQPLSHSIRCVNTQTCFACVSQSLEVATGEGGGGGAAAAAAAPPNGLDPLLAYLPLDDDHVGQVEGATISATVSPMSPSPIDLTPSSTPSAATLPPPPPSPSLPPPAPLPFHLPAHSLGLQTLSVDPRPLFALVQPRNIISIVTALMTERKVLVVSKDPSILLDVMYTLLSMLQPMVWAGTVTPQLPYPILGDLCSAVTPIFVGATPDVVRASGPYYEDEYMSSKFSDEEVSEAMRGEEWVGGGMSAGGDFTPSSPHSSACNTGPHGVGGEPQVEGAWCPPPIRWWMRYAHLLDPSVAEWIEADAERAKGSKGGGFPSSSSSTASSAFFHPVGGASPHTYTGEPPVWPPGYEEGKLEHQHVADSLFTVTLGMGMSLPPLSNNETEEGVGFAVGNGVVGGGELGGRHEGSNSHLSNSGGGGRSSGGGGRSGGGGGEGANFSYKGFVILDVDADAVSPCFLPPSYLLPSNISLRLWKACTTFAPLWSWRRQGVPLPPSLPLFSPRCNKSEVGAAEALWEKFRKRSAGRGWGEKGLIRQLPPLTSAAPAAEGRTDEHQVDGVFRVNGIFSVSHVGGGEEEEGGDITPYHPAHTDFYRGVIRRKGGVPSGDGIAQGSGGSLSFFTSFLSRRGGAGGGKAGGLAGGSSVPAGRGAILSKHAASLRTLNYLHSDEELEEEDEDEEDEDEEGEREEREEREGRGEEAGKGRSVVGKKQRETGLEVGGGAKGALPSLATEAVVVGGEEGEEGDTPNHSSLEFSDPTLFGYGADASPLPLIPPWSQWRAGVTATQQPLYRLTHGGDLTGARVLPVVYRQQPGSHLRLLVPEPSLNFTRIRLAFLSMWVSLLKSYRLYMSLDRRLVSASYLSASNLAASASTAAFKPTTPLHKTTGETSSPPNLSLTTATTTTTTTSSGDAAAPAGGGGGSDTSTGEGRALTLGDMGGGGSSASSSRREGGGGGKEEGEEEVMGGGNGKRGDGEDMEAQMEQFMRPFLGALGPSAPPPTASTYHLTKNHTSHSLSEILRGVEGGEIMQSLQESQFLPDSDGPSPSPSLNDSVNTPSSSSSSFPSTPLTGRATSLTDTVVTAPERGAGSGSGSDSNQLGGVEVATLAAPIPHGRRSGGGVWGGESVTPTSSSAPASPDTGGDGDGGGESGLRVNVPGGTSWAQLRHDLVKVKQSEMKEEVALGAASPTLVFSPSTFVPGRKRGDTALSLDFYLTGVSSSSTGSGSVGVGVGGGDKGAPVGGGSASSSSPSGAAAGGKEGGGVAVVGEAARAVARCVTLVNVALPPPPSDDIKGGYVSKCVWDQHTFLEAETSGVTTSSLAAAATAAAASSSSSSSSSSLAASSSLLLSHISDTIYFRLFISARLSVWDDLRRYLLHVRAWRGAMLEGKRRMKELMRERGGGGVEVVLCNQPPPLPPPIAPSDVFDRACFRRLVLRAARTNLLASEGMEGTLWKAMRGTLCKAWTQRYVQLAPEGVMAYYANPEAIALAKAGVNSARAVFRRAQALALREALGIPAGGGQQNQQQQQPSQVVQQEESKLRAAERVLENTLSDNFRDSFRLYPGHTILRVPPTENRMLPQSHPQYSLFSTFTPSTTPSSFANDGTSLPTRFPLQVINLATHRASPAPGMAPNDDILTLCFPSGEERRKWILHFRAHLRGMASAIPQWMMPLLGVGGAQAQPYPPSDTAAIPYFSGGPNTSSHISELFVRLLYVGDAASFTMAVLSEARGEGEVGGGGLGGLGGLGGEGGGEDNPLSPPASSFVTVSTVEAPEGEGGVVALARRLRDRASSILSTNSSLASSARGGGSGASGGESEDRDQVSRLNEFFSRARNTVKLLSRGSKAAAAQK